MKFLLDEVLSRRLARVFLARGHECIHVSHLKLIRADDRDIWRSALAQGFILVSKDEDFVALTLRQGTGGQLLWIRTGNGRVLDLCKTLEIHFDEMIAAFESGQRIFELR